MVEQSVLVSDEAKGDLLVPLLDEYWVVQKVPLKEEQRVVQRA